MKNSLLLNAVLVGMMVSAAASAANAEAVKTLGAVAQEPVAASYFGMQIHGWPTVPLGNSRVAIPWKVVEPERGKWDFSTIDAQVQKAEQHNVEVLFDMGATPPWASPNPNGQCGSGVGACWAPVSVQDWRDYVTHVAERYKGRVHYYQVWNEPNQKGAWQDTTEKMVTLAQNAYEILKRADSTNMVLSPAATGPRGAQWMDEFLSKGGRRSVDIIAYHFYPNPPECVIAVSRQLHDAMSKNGVGDLQVWDTELGWGQKDDSLPMPKQVAYAARLILLDRVAGASRFFWFIWNWPNLPIAMLDRDNTLAPPAKAYVVLHGWMLGAVIPGCGSGDAPAWGQASRVNWSCEVRRNGITSRIVWSPTGDRPYQPPPSWQIKTISNLAGETKAMPASGEITIGEQPILLQPGNASPQ